MVILIDRINILKKNINRFYKKKRKISISRYPSYLLKEKENLILKDTETFLKAAEFYFKEKKDERYLREKPFVLSKADLLVQIRFGLLVDALEIFISDTVLDFGAGSCWASALLNRMGVRTISLDVSKTALRIGKEVFSFDKRQKDHLNPFFVVYDGHRFPFADNSVDRILCNDAFHHVPNQQEILNEMFRVLREGGKAGFSEPGECHSNSKEAIMEFETYGVLENDIHLDDFKQKAEDAGFTGFYLKPYLWPNSMTLILDDYLDLIEGRNKSSIDQILSSINHLPIIILEKGKGIIDSRHPNVLKAKIEIIDKICKAKAGEVSLINVKVKNIGDTLWLSKPQGGACCVALGLHLVDSAKRRTDYARGYLTGDIPPGTEDIIRFKFIAPDKIGHYTLEFDMVDELVYWFSATGSEPQEMEIDVD